MTRLRIGTRGSSLALWQANHIADSLAKLHGVETELVRIRTSGDGLQSASVAQVNDAIGAEGGKGIFIKEIEDALLSGAVDLAVHSMKDVPTETPAGLAFAAITRREDPRDCLISRGGLALDALPRGARVGTSSLRRQAQLRHHRPNLDVADLRGNVDTRIRKLESGEFDAIVLAMAGVTRLGASAKVTQIFDEDLMLPAVGQGALGIE
ncbi:MAG: hydroxymethylbilane synthase, partial [Candidatus Acidiferrales bacterium]